MRTSTAILIVLLALVITGCGNNERTPIPRRTAFPRIKIYDSNYAQVPDTPLRILVNTDTPMSSEQKDDGTIWINTHYSDYNTTVYLTITPVDASKAADVIENRTERMHLNLGSSTTIERYNTNPQGYQYRLLRSTSTATTPIQFIAVNLDNPKWVLSGAAFFDNASSATSVDSITPIVDIIERDITVMLDSLTEI